MRYLLMATIFLLGMGALLPLSMAGGCSRCRKPYYKPKPKPYCPPKVKPPMIIPPIIPPPTLTCPVPLINIKGCINLLGGLVNINIGVGPLQQCCPLFHGLEPAVASHCLCSCYKDSFSDPSPYVPAMRGFLGGCGFPDVDIPCF